MPAKPTPIDHISDRLRNFFWSKVDGTRGLFDCWIWKGSTYKNTGYGFILIDGHRAGAHRFSWVLRNGPIPEGLEVCHDCDNPPCVNPLHLWLGTHLQNILDIKAKGTRSPAYGEAHGKSKLTTEQVTQIRELANQGNMTQREIGKMFGVSSTNVSYIKRGITRQLG